MKEVYKRKIQDKKKKNTHRLKNTRYYYDDVWLVYNVKKKNILQKMYAVCDGFFFFFISDVKNFPPISFNKTKFELMHFV